MAEFAEVIKKYLEVCDHFEDCSSCILKLANGYYCDDLMKGNPKEAEKLIMDWQPPVDWSKVEVDTPIYVRDRKLDDWIPRYFALYEADTVYAWSAGATSFSSDNDEDMVSWKYAKLAEKENQIE